jgi:hypothetical protein
MPKNVPAVRIVAWCLAFSVVACTNAEYPSPERSAVIVAGMVSDAEARHYARVGHYGLIDELTSSGELDARHDTDIRARAFGYQFDLHLDPDGKQFAFTAVSNQSSVSVDETGIIRSR